MTAEGAGERSTQSIELDVRNAGQPETEVTEAILEPGSTWEGTPEALGITGTNSAYLELSTLPPVDLGRRLQYLIDYPHGCLEQTTSKAFPQLYIADVMEMSDIMEDEMRRNVQAGLARLKQFQTAGGGFGYWPGDRDPNDWTTTYAGHFMVEAERKASPHLRRKTAWPLIPAGKRAIGHQTSMINGAAGGTNWHRPIASTCWPWRQCEAGAMNRLRTTPGLSDQAR